MAATPAKPTTPPPGTAWMRVKDRGTEHEYDVAPSAFDPEAHEDLQRYHSDRNPHPAKHRRALSDLTPEAPRG